MLTIREEIKKDGLRNDGTYNVKRIQSPVVVICLKTSPNLFYLTSSYITSEFMNQRNYIRIKTYKDKYFSKACLAEMN